MVKTFSVLALGLVVVVSVAAALEVPFGSRTTIDDTYLGPISIATGDLDGDGLDDLVVAGIADGSLAWWRSLGDGSFQRYPVVASATEIDDVEVADVNRDGRLDVVVTAAGTTDAVGWYENDGTPMDGGWPLRLIAYPFDGARGTAVGDMNGDGTPDVVGAAASAHVVSVAFNDNGTGIGWSYETVDAAFTGALWVSIGDIDTDGDIDIAAAAFISGEVSWWSSNFDGSWTEHPIATVADADVMELVDMDADGDLDALGAGSFSAVRWWENDGDGGTWTEHTVGDPSTTVAAAYPCDLDHDGDQDVLYAANGIDGIGWFENTNGDATSWQHHLVDGGFNGALDIAPLDFDNDGDLDLVAVDYGADEIGAWENLAIHWGTGFDFDVSMDDATDSIRDLETADYDGDGDLDVVYADFSAQEIGWFANTPGGGTGWVKVPIATGVDSKAVSVADVNADGLLDIVAGDGGNVYWWESLSAGGTTQHTIIDSLTQVDSVVADDFDGDGDVDVATGSHVDGIDWFENQGSGTWVAHSVVSAYIWDADCLTVADVDGDGDPDLVYSVWDAVRWASNELEEAGFSFGFPVDIATGLNNARSVAAGDVDSDGDMDVVAGDMGTGEVFWWANVAGDGTTWGSAEVVADGLPKPQSVELADFDLDGTLDVVVAAYDQTVPEGWLGYYELDWTGSWLEHEIEDDLGGVFALNTGDFDDDGMPDVVASDAQHWPNLGGQAEFKVAIRATPPTIDPLVLEDVLRLELIHIGEPGDAKVELAQMEVLLVDHVLDPLDDALLDDALVGIYVYADTDHSYSFDPTIDEVVGSVESFSTTDGLQQVPFTDGVGSLQASFGIRRGFFFVIAFETDASSVLPDGLVISVPQAGVVVEDADYDLMLKLKWRQDMLAGPYDATPDPSLVFLDGFESGGTTAWDAVSP